MGHLVSLHLLIASVGERIQRLSHPQDVLCGLSSPATRSWKALDSESSTPLLQVQATERHICTECNGTECESTFLYTSKVLSKMCEEQDLISLLLSQNIKENLISIYQKEYLSSPLSHLVCVHYQWKMMKKDRMDIHSSLIDLQFSSIIDSPPPPFSCRSIETSPTSEPSKSKPSMPRNQCLPSGDRY